MAGLIQVSEDDIWMASSGMFYNVVEYLLERAGELPSLRATLEFGLNSGAKSCDFRNASEAELAIVRGLLERYRAELPIRSQSWPDPAGLPYGIARLDELIGLLGSSRTR